ncbi:MAG: kelch repeat-containing protein [Planctomycetota bacterium]
MNSLLKTAALSALAAAANAQAFNWTLETPTASPTARERVATATDGTLYYLYGGQNGTSVTGLDQLWSYDGTTWTLQTGAGASCGTRAGASAAFDIARGKLVVFGGKLSFATGAPLLNDTWEWDATNGWVQITPATTTPDTRWLTNNCVYVPGQGVIFHGGVAIDSLGTTYRSNETWRWDGSDWFLLANNGPAVDQPMMVYRSNENDLILHGGQTPTGAAGALELLGQTWRFDFGTSTWTQLTTGGTNPFNSLNAAQGLFGAMAYYNPLTSKMVVHGGNGGSSSSKTWQFDGTDWSDISTNGVGCRNGGMQWVAALGKGVYGPCNEANGAKNRTRTHGPQSWGSFDLSGSDCPVVSSGLTAGLSAASLPWIGSNLAISLTNTTAADLQFVLLGTSTMAPLALSAILPGSGAACDLQITPDVIELASTYNLAIPNNPVFVGVVLYAQGLQTELIGLDIAAANTQFATITVGQL